MEHAACINMDAEQFFPQFKSQRQATKALIREACGNCIVREQCLRYARQIRATHGVWGGREINPRRKYTDDDEIG